MKVFVSIFSVFVSLLFFSSCEKKNTDPVQSCNNGKSGYSLTLELDHQNNSVVIDATDINKSDDCDDFDFIITVAPLYGATSPQEIAQALLTQSIYNKRIAIEEEGVKQHSANLSNLEDDDTGGTRLVYACYALKVPKNTSPSDYVNSEDYNSSNFKMIFFGSYEGGDAPDIGPCGNCSNGTCPNGTPISCGCHGGFCLCTLCIEEVIFS